MIRSLSRFVILLNRYGFQSFWNASSLRLSLVSSKIFYMYKWKSYSTLIRIAILFDNNNRHFVCNNYTFTINNNVLRISWRISLDGKKKIKIIKRGRGSTEQKSQQNFIGFAVFLLQENYFARLKYLGKKNQQRFTNCSFFVIHSDFFDI